MTSQQPTPADEVLADTVAANAVAANAVAANAVAANAAANAVATDETAERKSAAVATAKRRGKALGGFLSGQILAQVFSLVAGIWLVRSLSRTEYAFFTIANTMQGAMNVLADSGISIAVMSIGGQIWQDGFRLGQLTNAALRLRKGLAAGAALLIAPILGWMLVTNGASPLYALCLIGAVLLALHAQLTTGVLEVVPRLRSELVRLTQLDVIAALTRLLLLTVTYFISRNAAVAVLTASLSLMIKNSVLTGWVKADIDTAAPPLAEDRQAILQIVKHQAPNGVFFCFQGQIVVWLVSIFGKSHSIAEVGALGRLSMVFLLVGTLMANVVAPRFAKCSKESVLRFYGYTLSSVTTVLVMFLLVVYLFPGSVLWILGSKYANLRSELFLMSLGTAVNAFTGVLWTMNASRAWIQFIWLNIPATLVTELAILPFLNVGSTQGVILFGLYSSIPHLLLNIYMSYRGVRELRQNG